MADYRKMYLTLFNKITDVIEELEEVQQMAEEMYINEETVHLSPLPNQNNRMSR
ncbi:hypothetical protein [Ethanoligenens harbinense]|uniref:Uncharacterized protein n=1 Tax=Ethanoligenens harbinense (strain DSM 18485 / JCM 12961 / CGMCC 1.5033 / YUAN-3) TaxID=663278 RepID=E6U3B1_ETHHY|nr:hypothetical protein [Ethanoligenens harbinense]ADU26403.1 hypothetical protein Ethha_0834 [Ethanoligenens harbinense YUAN-3]